MILIHTVFLLSVISGFSQVAAAPQTLDTKADVVTSSPTEVTPAVTPGIPEAKSNEAKTEKAVEQTKAVLDVDKSTIKGLPKDVIDRLTEKGVADELLLNAIDKIVSHLHGDRSASKALESLPLSLGDKFDYLLLKIPKPGQELKKEDVGIQLKDAERKLSSDCTSSPLATLLNLPCQNQQQTELQIVPAQDTMASALRALGVVPQDLSLLGVPTTGTGTCQHSAAARGLGLTEDTYGLGNIALVPADQPTYSLPIPAYYPGANIEPYGSQYSYVLSGFPGDNRNMLNPRDISSMYGINKY